MSEVLKTKPPVWFWIVVSLLMIWNVMGIVSWSSDAFFPEEMLDQYSPEQQALFAERPGWIMPVYAVAVFGAFFGTIMMLRQSRLAMPLFVISLIAVLIQFGYVLFIMDAIGKLGFAMAASFPIVIVVIGVVEIAFAQFAKGKGWLV